MILEIIFRADRKWCLCSLRAGGFILSWERARIDQVGPDVWKQTCFDAMLVKQTEQTEHDGQVPGKGFAWEEAIAWDIGDIQPIAYGEHDGDDDNSGDIHIHIQKIKIYDDRISFSISSREHLESKIKHKPAGDIVKTDLCEKRSIGHGNGGKDSPFHIVIGPDAVSACFSPARDKKQMVADLIDKT